MLLRLDALEHVGRFAKLKHKAEPFSDLTLVFGRNGYGKSTLCAVLRSISEGNPNHIAARRRLQSSQDPRIQTTWHPTQTVAFGGGKWNARPGAVHVFDQEFVNQNLHIGDSVTRENKRKLLPVVLGQGGVKLAQDILVLDKEQRDLDAAMKRDAALIKAKYPVISAEQLLPYCSREIPDDVKNHIANAERSVQLAKQSVAVQSKKALSLIDLPAYDIFEEVCARTLESSAENLAQRMRLHMETHALKPPTGERWLKYGLDHIANDHCPFCSQSLHGVDMIGVYSAYFSEAFNRLLLDRDQLVAKIESVLEGTQIASLITENDADALFWQTVCELEELPSLPKETQATIGDGLHALRRLLGQKTSNPLAVVRFGGDAEIIQSAFEAIRRYNEVVSDCVRLIERARQEAVKIDLARAEKTKDSWIALAGKSSEPIKSAASNYAAAEKRRSAIDNEKKAAQAKLTAFAVKTIVSRQQEINDLLSDFGASFSIIDAKANFRGREPNTEFAIAIGSRKVLVGEVLDTEPCFKTVLSTGDKTTLALAFFLTQVKSDPDLANSIIIFDDPFHSQDMHRQFETTSHIRALSKRALQTIVFSHDPRFLQMIEKDANNAKTRTFQLLCTDDGNGAIPGWSSADELKSLYVQQSEMIREYAIHGNLLPGITYNTVHQAIRPFLEDYLKLRFPSRFAPLDQIHTMATVIETAGADDPMYEFVGDLLALNEYTRVNMHGGGQVADPNALRAQARKVVKIVGSY